MKSREQEKSNTGIFITLNPLTKIIMDGLQPFSEEHSFL